MPDGGDQHHRVRQHLEVLLEHLREVADDIVPGEHETTDESVGEPGVGESGLEIERVSPIETLEELEERRPPGKPSR